jgi:Bifunctional DNA primase/polymerase, N-terminal
MKSSDAALRTGWHCFPCLANKAPACPRGFHAATNDPATLMDLWRRHPGPLVGVATGPRSDVVCLDIDCGEGKANAASARAWLAENEYRLPSTRRYETQSGGVHVLFKHAPGFRCSTSLIALGVDTKGEARADKDGAVDGGYFVFWPAAGTRVLVRASLAPAPPWLSDLLAPKPKPISAFPTTKAEAAPCSASIRGALRVLAAAREGERNTALFWVSCRMGEAVRAGAVTESEALALLTSVGRQVGLLDREIVRTARSGLREGLSS